MIGSYKLFLAIQKDRIADLDSGFNYSNLHQVITKYGRIIEMQKEYLQEELNALSGTKETSVVVESKDRETKKSKSSSESSEVKEKPSPSESSEVKGKGSLIDDYANPNNEFGD